jgi:glc operon protein GlcG
MHQFITAWHRCLTRSEVSVLSSQIGSRTFRKSSALNNSTGNIAIVNDGTKLVYFEHMDGAFLGSIDISQQKAITSAQFPFPTRVMGELAFGKDGKPGDLPGIANVPGVIAFAGGLPIMTGSEAQIGAIGVSGGSADEDEECAKAALEAVANDLK